ncbi:MAG: hypothetical protein EBS72_05800, partial [Rhizobiales bacterium]|nr:hypothetical protein [Hyphomicrobiales bacterium]
MSQQPLGFHHAAGLTGRWRIGFDIGGTFTDFILYDDAHGAVTLHKR